MVELFLADGFEEIEALTVVDLLRRAQIEIRTVSVTGNKTVHGAHGIDVIADTLFEETNDNAEMLILPGGMPGTKNLGAHEGLCAKLRKAKQDDKYLAAICAAPTVFGALGFLDGKKATCYPGMEEGLTGATVSYDAVVKDGKVITSRGMGTAIEFALCIIATLKDQGLADQLAKGIVYRN